MKSSLTFRIIVWKTPNFFRSHDLKQTLTEQLIKRLLCLELTTAFYQPTTCDKINSNGNGFH